MTDLMGGRVDLSFDLLPTYTEQIRNNKLRALAVTTLDRPLLRPDAATLSERGTPNLEGTGWPALGGPAGLAPETIQKLNRTVNDYLTSEEGKSALLNFGMEPL